MSSSRKGGALVAATMKRLAKFTAADLSGALALDENNARGWVRDFHAHNLIQPCGIGQRQGNGVGVHPTMWEWQG